MAEFQMFGGTIHSALVHAATEYDRRQSSKRSYNPYALAQYLARIDEVERDIAAGASVRSALCAGFHDRLLDHLLKAVGEPKHAPEEVGIFGVVYRRATAKRR